MPNLTGEQQNVVRNIIRDVKSGNQQITTLSGHAGCGKTTCLAVISDVLPGFAVCAFTGKAANVLRKKGMTASTIHSLIYKPLVKPDGKVEFVTKEKYELGCDGFLVDEACLPYHQRIKTAKGWETIGKIVSQKKRVEVLSYNFNTRKIEPKKVINWFKYPRKSDILMIRASDKKNREMQKNLRCTPNHQVYLSNGEKVLASELKIGDELLIGGKFFNQEQKDFLMGSLMGDASISGNNPQLSFRHGDKQKKYLNFKRKLFCQKKPARPYPSGYNPSSLTWGVSIARTDDLSDIYKLVYPGGKKTITREWLDQVAPIGLAAWYMDDGCLEKQVGGCFNAQLHTEGFSEAENKIIKEWLKEKYDLNASVYRSNQYFKIRLDKKSSDKFFQIIAPWFCLNMVYKLPAKYRPKKEIYLFNGYKDHGVLGVRSIEKWNVVRPGSFVYDIEVEDNHNYFAGNILVSNSMIGKYLYEDLLSFFLPIVFVGDHGQLEPIGQDVYVMKDPMYKLETIHRNAGEIAYFAEHLRKGYDARSFKAEKKVIFCTSEEVTDEMMLKTDQMICAFNRTRVAKNDHVRKLLGRKKLVEVGDRVMCLRNNKKQGLFNGQQGEVVKVKKGKFDFYSDDTMYADVQYDANQFGQEKPQFEFGADSPNPFDYAYTITGHKSQGDEFDNVIVFEQQCDKWENKRWFYTTASRAKESLIWVCGRKYTPDWL